jgi:hypothetical protein
MGRPAASLLAATPVVRQAPSTWNGGDGPKSSRLLKSSVSPTRAALRPSTGKDFDHWSSDVVSTMASNCSSTSPMRCIGGSVKNEIEGLRTRVQFRNRESNWQMITGRKLDEVAT